MRRSLAALIAACGLTVAACGSTESADPAPATVGQRADFQWVIPQGTAEKVSLGTHDPIFPAVLYVKVGQSIRIINEDRIGYTVGPFYVGANQTLEQIIRAPGTFEGECTTHQGARFMMIVEQ